MPKNRKRRNFSAGKSAAARKKASAASPLPPESAAGSVPPAEVPAPAQPAGPESSAAPGGAAPEQKNRRLRIPLPDRAAVRAGLKYFGRGVRVRIVKKNAVVFRTVAVCTVLAAATTLKNGLLLSAAAVAVIIPLALIMALARRIPPMKKCPAFVWPALALLLAGALTMPACWLAYRAAPNVTASTGIFLPLTALNAALMVGLVRPSGGWGVLPALTAGVGDSLGFSAVVILFAAIREIIGKGTLYTRPIFGHVQFGFLQTPAGAFLLLGCLLAAVQWCRQRRAGKRSGEHK